MREQDWTAFFSVLLEASYMRGRTERKASPSWRT